MTDTTRDEAIRKACEAALWFGRQSERYEFDAADFLRALAEAGYVVLPWTAISPLLRIANIDEARPASGTSWVRTGLLFDLRDAAQDRAMIQRAGE